MKIGIQISSLKPYIQTKEDLELTVSKLSDIGYHDVQLQWLGRDIPANTVADILKRYGMTSWGTQDYYERVKDDFSYYLELCQATGGKYMCFSGIPQEFYQNRVITRDTIHRLAEECNGWAEKLAKYGMTATFHPRVNECEMVDGVPAILRLLEETEPRFHFTLDTNPVARVGADPAEWIVKMKDRVEMIHYKEVSEAARECSRLVPAGRGILDKRSIFEACGKAGVEIVFAEQETWEKDAFLCMKESFEFLSR